MRFLPQLLANNRTWALQQTQRDPEFFERLCAIQKPQYLWIGCADSRVPANEIVGLIPGELFVHRNIGNIVRQDDPNCLSVLQYAVDFLQVSHIIVTGHDGCGGVQAAFGPPTSGPLEGWIAPIRLLRQTHARELALLPDDHLRWQRLCELNVMDQVRVLTSLPTIVRAWARGQQLAVHGWIYDLHNGLIRDLGVSVNSAPTR
jgi:carbonic anhydrase